MITHDPLHRSGQAALPHPAPTLGDDAQAHERIRMTNTSRRKPASHETQHSASRQTISLGATAQDRAPEKSHPLAEGAKSRTVYGYPVVTEVTQQDRAQVRPLFRRRRVQASPQFVFQVPQLGLPPLPHRLPQNREPALPRLRAAVRKSEKVEGPWFAVATVAPIPLRKAAELDDTRFVGMQFQCELRETLASSARSRSAS